MYLIKIKIAITVKHLRNEKNLEAIALPKRSAKESQHPKNITIG